ncbi:MAG: hypothetical protein V3V67_18960 [Myxococcota bacterium]
MARPVLLVHGAWHGAWCWAKVIDALRERGVEVRADVNRLFICSEDQAVPAELQRELAKRATATVTWRASHSPFFSIPAQVAELLGDLAAGRGVA